MARPKEYNKWFHTSKPVKFIMVDYKVSFFLLLFMLHMRLYTFLILVVIFCICYILELNKLSLVNAVKRLRLILGGSIRKRR